MITKDEAKKKVTKMLNGSDDYNVKFVKEIDGTYLFLVIATDQDIMPSKIVAAVNKDSGKIGRSMTSIEDAINGSK